MKVLIFPTLLILLILIQSSSQSTDDGDPVVVTMALFSVNINEQEKARVQLGGGPVLSCIDGGDNDAIRVYIDAVAPFSGCDTSCFQMLPCDADYCVWFVPNQGSLDATVAPVLTLTLVCTDDLEDAVRQDLTVIIVPNNPPEFTVAVAGDPLEATIAPHGLRTNHKERQKLYQVEATDPEGDPIFYSMTTSPIVDFLEIEYTSGMIKATKDFRMLCLDKVVASVWIKDAYNARVGPFTVNIDIANNNQRPTVSNLDTTITYAENQRVGAKVHGLEVIDARLNDHTYNLRAVTPIGLEPYFMRGTDLRSTEILNYERADTRSTKLFFNIEDGFCVSETYSLTVDVTDEPEAPEYTHYSMLLWADEGIINVPNEAFVLDEDLNEVHVHYKDVGSFAALDVHSETGNVITPQPFFLANNVRYKEHKIRMRVRDKDGLISRRYAARVRVFDVNNQRPYFTNGRNPIQLTAHECTPPGAILGRCTGNDLDSNYRLNNWIYFGGGGGKMMVAANGQVILTEVCKNGETFTGTATIADQGIKPNPLRGDTLGILLFCGPCPPPGAADGDDGGSGGSGNSTDINGTSGSSADPDTLLVWAAPALVAAALWLALTACLLYHYWKNPCQQKPKLLRVSPEPAPSTKSGPPPSQKTKPAPPQPPPKPHPPVPQQAPRTVSPSEPYLMDFWKETYTNQDQSAPTSKHGKPRAIEEMPAWEGTAQPPPNLRLGGIMSGAAMMPRFQPGNAPVNSIRGSDAAPAQTTPPSNKNCIIS